MSKLPRSGHRSGGLLSLPLCLWSVCVIGAFGGPQVRPKAGDGAVSPKVGDGPMSQARPTIGQEFRYACPAGCWCGNYSNGGDRISCRNLGLTALPPMPTSGTSGVTQLWLDGNSLAELPDRGLQSLSGLTRLDADNNKVTLRLRKYSFYGLSKLQVLYLFNSNIEHLPVGVFHGLSKLTLLWLHGNKIHKLQADTFNGLPLLTHFPMYDNRSPMEVEDFAFRGAAPLLTTLDLYGCQGLSLSPLAFSGGLTKVTQINVQRSKLAEVKAGTFQYQPLLKVLHLEEQGLDKELGLEPGAFNGSVEEVYLGGNNLTSLPDGLFSEGSKISKLDLSRNNLTGMPRGVFRPLKNLSYVDLRANHYIDCKTIDELKAMSLTTLAHDSCVFYPDVTSTTYPDVMSTTYPDVTSMTYPDVTSTTPAPGPARPCFSLGGGLPSVLHLCPSYVSDAARCGADASSNCCWVEVGGGYGLCIVSPSLKGLE